MMNVKFKVKVREICTIDTLTFSIYTSWQCDNTGTYIHTYILLLYRLYPISLHAVIKTRTSNYLKTFRSLLTDPIKKPEFYLVYKRLKIFFLKQSSS